MNEEKANQQENQGVLDPKRKTALLRYLAVLFAAAFLLVLLSLLMQIRDSNTTISELSQSSSSALQNAERLQQDNASLREENKALEEQLEALTEELEQLTKQNSDMQRTAEAYEQLLQTMMLVTPGAQEGNVAAGKALEALENYKNYLGPNGLEIYHQLMEEGRD